MGPRLTHGVCWTYIPREVGGKEAGRWGELGGSGRGCGEGIEEVVREEGVERERVVTEGVEVWSG